MGRSRTRTCAVALDDDACGGQLQREDGERLSTWNRRSEGDEKRAHEVASVNQDALRQRQGDGVENGSCAGEAVHASRRSPMDGTLDALEARFKSLPTKAFGKRATLGRRAAIAWNALRGRIDSL